MLLCYYGSNKRTGILGNLSAGTLNRCGTLIRYSRVFQSVGRGISMVSLVLGDSLASPTLFMSKSKLLLMIKSDTSLLLVSLLYDLSWKWNIIRKRRHWSLLQRRRESQHHFSMKHSFFWVANKHTVPKMYVECIVSIVIQPDFSLDTMIQ